MGSFFTSAMLGVLLGALGACGQAGAPTPCEPSTCAGCCAGNECVPTPTQSACGAGGEACAPCRGNEACVDGLCVTEECDGCFDSVSLLCIAGTADNACGQGGTVCATCGSGTACQDGKCVSTACAGCLAGTQCAPGNTNMLCGAGGVPCETCVGTESCQDRTCVAPVVCGATNCASGCCDDNDTCQAGNANTNCGTGGGRCSTCTGATCTAGECKAPCGPDNCSGCCTTNGTCVASTPSTCGANGATCVACGAGDLCSSGTCIATTCKSTCPGCCSGSTCKLGNTAASCGISGNSCIACPSTQVCTNGTCRVDQNSLWDFLVYTGDVAIYENPPTNDSTWDSFGGLPDPYVEVDLSYGQPDELIGKGPSVNNTITPNWGGAKVFDGVKASLLLKASYLQVWDDDSAPSPDDDMGFCTFSITQASFSGALITSTCTKAGKNPWTVRWKILPH